MIVYTKLPKYVDVATGAIFVISGNGKHLREGKGSIIETELLSI